MRFKVRVKISSNTVVAGDEHIVSPGDTIEIRGYTRGFPYKIQLSGFEVSIGDGLGMRGDGCEATLLPRDVRDAK